MATILEEAIRLGADPNLAIAALSMPSRAPVTGAMRYTIPGEGGSEFIRARTPEEVAAAARQLGGVAAANANPFAGRVFGNTIGQAQGASLNRRQQDIASMQFQQQMAAQERRAQEQNQLRRDLVAAEWNSRQNIADQNRMAQMAAVQARLAGSPAGGARVGATRSAAAATPAGGTTIADILYGQQAQLLAQQPGIELSNEALESLSEGRLSAAQSLFGAQGAQRGFDQSILSADEAEAIGVPPYTTMADAVRLASQRGPENEAALKILESRIAAERASGRLGNALPVAPAPQLSPLAALLLRQPGTAGPGGTIQYSPEQVSAARSALGWRGAYGGPGVSAFGSNPAEQARMQAARRMATMAPSAAQMVEPAMGSAPANVNYTLIPNAAAPSSAAMLALGAPVGGFPADTGLPTYAAAGNPIAALANLIRSGAGAVGGAARRLATWDYPSEPAPLVPTGGRTTSWPGPAYVEPAVNPGVLDLLAGRTPETATMSPAQRVAAAFGIAF